MKIEMENDTSTIATTILDPEDRFRPVGTYTVIGWNMHIRLDNLYKTHTEH